MKYINAVGGLGNQMFCYAFCVGFRQQNKKAFLFVAEPESSKSYGHQGYELEKLFPLIHKEEAKYKGYRKYLFFVKKVLKKIPKRYRNNFLNLLFQIEEVRELKGFVFSDKVYSKSKTINQLYFGNWQSYKYFKGAETQVKHNFGFNKTLLSKNTVELAEEMANCNSVSIHIRRDDYMSEKFVEGLGSVCTEEYYSNAVNYILDKVKDCKFYVFTDDHKWVSDNFKLNSATFVQFNNNEDSWQDMYLMGQCKHNIIANSTFSWWGAWLNDSQDKIVISPKRWWSSLAKDDVIPEEWIRL